MAGDAGRLRAAVVLGRIADLADGRRRFVADVCIVDDSAGAEPELATNIAGPPVRRGGGILASQAADNLYWFGRYVERGEATLRVLRSILGSSIEADSGADRDAKLRRFLVELLEHWEAISEEAAKDSSLAQMCSAALVDNDLPGGVGTLIRNSQRVGLSLREPAGARFLADHPPPAGASRRRKYRGSARRGQGPARTLRHAIGADRRKHGPRRCLPLPRNRPKDRARDADLPDRPASPGLPDEAEALNLLLDLCDSQIIYRSRYLSGAVRDPVYDLVLLDPTTRSLMFQLEDILRHIAALPTLADDGMPEAPLRETLALLAPLRGLPVEQLDQPTLARIEERLLALSDTIAVRYFLPIERNDRRIAGNLLG